jgi:thioesterase domain-containing protein
VADIVLVHSPFLGPISLQRTGAELEGLGHRVNAPDLRGVWAEPGPWARRIADAAAAPGEVHSGEDELVIAGHSGAGPLLPSIADRIAAIGRDVSALLFVDAGLPYPQRSWNQTAPAALVAEIRGLARDGRVPPWHEWFLPEVLTDLLPDASERAALAAEEPSVPLAYFDEAMPADDWAGPGAYLLLSGGADTAMFRPPTRVGLPQPLR